MPISRLTLLFLLIVASCGPARAQTGFSGGFRAGLNFMTFEGDQAGDGTMTFEEFDRTTGFHVGATFAYAFTDLVGVKANFMYTQKGAEILYEGPGFLALYQNPNDRVGDLRRARLVTSEIDVVNSYLEIPVTAYYRLGPLEIEGGLSAGFLVNSRASGALVYSDFDQFAPGEVTINIDANYFQDQAGPDGILGTSDVPLPGTNDFFPPNVIGAYYNHTDDSRRYRSLDFGAIAGIAYYLQNGLFLGVRYQHGFTDVSNGDNDLARTLDSNNERQFDADDEDFNRSIQASVGFRF